MGLKDLLENVMHAGTCAYWSVDDTGAEEACTCGLSRYRLLMNVQPDKFLELVEATFDLAEADSMCRPVDKTQLGRYQVAAHEVEKIALKAYWPPPMTPKTGG